MESTIGSLPVTVVKPAKESAPPLFLIPGLGFRRGVYAPMQAALAAAGVPTLAVDLPDGETTFDGMSDALVSAVSQVPGCAVLGHSLSGPFAQVVAHRVTLHALILVNSFPAGGVSLIPTRGLWLAARRYGLAAARRKPVRPSYDHMLAFGLDLAPDDQRRAAYEAMIPLTGGLTRQILARPFRPDPGAAHGHTLVCTARQDRLVHWQVGRRIGEWLDAVIWRYDDLGHLPFFQTAAARLYGNIAEFVHSPHARKVTEADAWSPGEGRGLGARDAERGEAGAQRSAYGQRAGRQGASLTDRWDQNLR